jgi:hypothetical protein
MWSLSRFAGDLSLLELERGSNSYMHVQPFESMAKAGSGGTVVTLEWKHDFLISLLAEKSELSSQLRSVLTNSVMRKLIDIDKTNSKSKYITLLRAFAIDGVIDDLERSVLEEYKKNHDIDAATHERGLSMLGWSEEEFQRGRKNSSMFFINSLNSLQKKLMGVIEQHHQDDVDEIIVNIKKRSDDISN